MSRYGEFNATGDQYVVTDPNTPRPLDTMLFNDACYANIHHTGLGCFDYQPEGKEGIQLLTGVGRVCDYDVFGKEHLYSRLIYIRDNESGAVWNVNWEPLCRPYEVFSCRHRLGSVTITNCTNGVRAAVTITVPPGKDPVELWSLTLEDTEERPRELTVFAYFQLQFRFKWGFDSYGNMIYHTTGFDRQSNTFFAEKHPYVRPHNDLTAFFSSDEPIVGYDGSRRIFMGQYGTVLTPAAVQRGSCFGSDGSAEDCICALQWNIPLRGQRREWHCMLGASDSRENCLTLRDAYLYSVPLWTERAESNRKESFSVIDLHTAYPELDRIMNYWVKSACLYGATWCRWGYNGYRDIVQHGMGISDIAPQRTKEILREAFAYQYAYGMAVRGWNPMDDRPYSDSALWSIYALEAYIKETGDRAFLLEEIPYLDGKADTVLHHALQALEFLENNTGAHGLVLIKFGDWNDSLTGAGKAGKGESVWLSMAYVYALSAMAELCCYGGMPETAEELRRREARMRTALEEQAWEEDHYLRCFADDGTAIGSSHDRYGRIFLETQAFSLMTGLGSGERQRRLLQALDERASTPIGYRLLAPAFREFDDRVGRLSAMEPGIAENGTVYTHPNFWLALGLLKTGYTDRAFDLIRKLIPGWSTPETEAIKEENPEYIFANGFFGPEHKNNPFQMEYTWITGSVAWARKTIEEWLLGIRPDYAGLRIDPHLPLNFGAYRVERVFRNCRYAIEVSDRQRETEKTILFDGKPLASDVLPILSDGRTHSVRVLFE